MIDVSLMGDFVLVDAAAGKTPALSRKARALFAYLVLTPGRAVPRDRLATLLWGDRGEEQARGSLRQTLYELRALAGPASALLVSRHDVCVRHAQLRTDLDAVRAAAAAGDAATMARRLGHPVLPLLTDLDDVSAGYDEWLRVEREGWRQEWRAAALAVAGRMLADGAAVIARPLVQTMIADDPADEAAAMLGMEMAYALGDRIGITRVFATLEQALRRDLDVAPAAATRERRDRLLAEPGLAATQPGPDHRPDPLFFVRPEPRDAADATPPGRDDPPTRRLPLSRNRWRLPIVAAVAALAIAFGLGIAQWRHHPHDRLTVIVGPLHIPANDGAAQALGGSLSTALARLMVGTDTPVDIVDAADAAMVPPGGGVVIGGNAVTVNGRVYVTIRLSAGSPSTMIWSRDFSRAATALDPLTGQIATSIGRELHFAYGGGRGQVLADDPELARLYLAGSDWIGKDFAEAARYFGHVVARRPDFAPGWSAYAAGLAISAGALPANARPAARSTAIAAARRALALDPTQGLAYYAIAVSRPGLANWSARAALLDRGLTVDPREAELNDRRGGDLFAIGRTRDAADYFRRAVDVDHFLPGKTRQLARFLAETGEIEEAQTLVQKGQDVWPDIAWFDAIDFLIAYRWGDPVRAKMLLARRGDVDAPPIHLATLRALIQWRTVPSPASNAAAVAAVRAEARSAGPSFALVQDLAWLGRIDDAFAMAATIPTTDDPADGWYRQELAPLRADPRFMTLAAHLGLAQIWLNTRLWPDFCSGEKLAYDCKAEARRAVIASAATPHPSR